jgi:hypothetical protein
VKGGKRQKLSVGVKRNEESAFLTMCGIFVLPFREVVCELKGLMSVIEHTEIQTDVKPP